MKLPSTATMIRIFRGLAIAEASSWAALLLGMVLKWITRTTELGVEIAGPIHGAFFIGYAIAALSLWAMLRWPFPGCLALRLLSLSFPFATVWFERWAGRHGHLTGPASGVPSGALVGSELVGRELVGSEQNGEQVTGDMGSVDDAAASRR